MYPTEDSKSQTLVLSESLIYSWKHWNTNHFVWMYVINFTTQRMIIKNRVIDLPNLRDPYLSLRILESLCSPLSGITISHCYFSCHLWYVRLRTTKSLLVWKIDICTGGFIRNIMIFWIRIFFPMLTKDMHRHVALWGADLRMGVISGVRWGSGLTPGISDSVWLKIRHTYWNWNASIWLKTTSHWPGGITFKFLSTKHYIITLSWALEWCLWPAVVEVQSLFDWIDWIDMERTLSFTIII